VAVIVRIPIPDALFVRSLKAWALGTICFCLLALATGCGKIRQEQRETVYVWARQMYLRDRVAAVSNHVGEVHNGEPLEVLEHGRRFLRVKTDKNEIGWIPDRAVIDGKTYQAFVQLASEHKNAPVVAVGTLRDEIYLHVSPGRSTDRFYLLPGDEKVQMLVRASVPKEQAATPAQASMQTLKPAGVERTAATATPEPAKPETTPVPMEDWWLVRDNQGRVGWALGNRVDPDVPDDIAQYAEGQRVVGAYVIAKVHDEGANTANNEVSEYVTALAPPKAGLPYDFDQIRVFTWSLKRHRYETAFRIHPIQGYLPVRISSQAGTNGTEPVFSFQISGSPDVSINPETGIAKPANPRTISYALRDTQVRRVGPDMAPIPVIHAAGEKPRAAKKRK
jgi:hypothetical protein